MEKFEAELEEKERLCMIEEKVNLSVLISSIASEDHLEADEYLQLEDSFENRKLNVAEISDMVVMQSSLSNNKILHKSTFDE